MDQRKEPKPLFSQKSISGIVTKFHETNICNVNSKLPYLICFIQCIAFCGDRNSAHWTQCVSDVCYIFGIGLVKYVSKKSLRGTEWD